MGIGLPLISPERVWLLRLQGTPGDGNPCGANMSTGAATWNRRIPTCCTARVLAAIGSRLFEFLIPWHGMAEGYVDAEKDVDPARSKAVQIIKELIESLPFPAIANDWQHEEIRCIAMNDHYVENQNCPREFLMNKNNRVLDPTHLTSLPGSVRVGIRAALAYGCPFDTNFETVMSASPSEKFIKRVSIRWQHHLGKDMRYGLSNAEWWTLAALRLQEKAGKAVESAAAWIAEPTGIFQQTDILCRKEDLDKAIWKSLDALKFPILLCDPFLPECPVIGVNPAAQTLTDWAAAGDEVTLADAKLLSGAGPLQRGAQYLTYGRYDKGEELERVAVRTACANGRPCSVAFRGMYAFRGKCSMWLQGVTVAQGVNKGPLGGGMQIWYLATWLDAAGCGHEDGLFRDMRCMKLFMCFPPLSRLMKDVGVLSEESPENWANAAPKSPALEAVKARGGPPVLSMEKWWDAWSSA
eukprot:Skav220057  [mRNA]  locus=scaffold1709:5302:27213:- [translate_table: standard]